MSGALVRYRIMAFVVGTGLCILVFVGVPLQYGAGVTWVAEVVGILHGYLYIVYLIAAADLARRAHWRLTRILLVIAAGFVPFLAFIVEHHVYQQMRREMDGAGQVAEGRRLDAGSEPRPGR
ncbi:MAG: DUF3817 domain-containing protein [Acidimicrobiales bacterium]